MRIEGETPPTNGPTNPCCVYEPEPIVDEEPTTDPPTKEFSQQVCPEDLDFLDIMNISSSTLTGFDIEHDDESFVPNDTFEEFSDTSQTEEPIDTVAERKFVIYESQLDILLKNMFRADGSVSVIKSASGTNISVKVKCSNGKRILDWSSQPQVGKFYGFNLIVCSSIVFSGETYESIKKPMEFAGLQFVNQNTFYKIQRNLVIPSINKLYEQSITAAREESHSDTVVIGDGRFDSPGKCAKYCTYSLQSPTTKKIIATSTVQTSKGKGSSPLELVGFKECLEQLERNDFTVSTIATDRNKQLSKWLREQRPGINHRYDPWHFAKNIKGKLRPLAKRKGCKIISEWIKPIGNHLFFCAQNCDNDPEKLIEMWKSLLHHISNRHTFGKVYKKYPKCMHKKYTKKEAQKKKWITKNSPVYHQIEKVIMDKRNLNDMPKLADPYHTGSIEVFNSLVNMYASKRKEFDYNVMDARIKLAAIDYNINSNREQGKIKKQRCGSGQVGEKKWKFQVAKQSKEWIAKEVKAAKSFSFVNDLLQEVVAMKLSGTSVDTPSSEIEWALKGPKNIAASERPDPRIIIEKREKLGRFVK